MARSKKKGLREPEGVGFSVKREARKKKHASGRPSNIGGPDNLKRWLTEEIPQRVKNLEDGKTKLLTGDQVKASLQRHAAKLRKS